MTRLGKAVLGEPVLFATAIRLTLVALLVAASVFGWTPDDPDQAMAAIGAVVVAMEGWLAWLSRSLVTPQSEVDSVVAVAEAQAHADGYRQAEDDVRVLNGEQVG